MSELYALIDGRDDSVVCEGSSHDTVMRDGYQYFEDDAYDNIFPEGYDYEDEYEFDVTVRGYDENGEIDYEKADSITVEYQQGDEEHSTLW